MNFNLIHPDFQLNGYPLTAESLQMLLDSKQPEEQAIGNFIAEWLDEKPFVTVQTSGSTGVPKSILLKKTQMAASAKATSQYFGLPEKTTALLCMSVNYIAGKMMLVRAMECGWHLDTVNPRSNPLDATAKAYDFSAMVPLQVQNSIDQLYRIKQLIIGGAAVSPVLEKQLQSVSTQMYATYGMTETITHIAVKKLNHTSGKNAFEALQGVLFSTDERGCLIIDAPLVTDEKVITNDVVDLLSETRFHWLGRADFVINSGGVKIHPEQVEEKLATQINALFFIAGIPDERLGEQVVLIIESKEKFNKKFDFSVLEKYEIPKEIYFISEFVYTETGKINRVETIKKK